MKERGNKLLKILDKNFGIPLIFLLGVWRKIFRKSMKLASPKAIICLKSAAIGDTVILSGVLLGLRESHPDVKIILAVGNSNAEFAKLLTTTQPNGAPAIVDQILVLPMSKPFQAVRALRSVSAEIIFDFDSWPRINAVLCFFSNVKKRVGFATKGQFRHFAFDKAGWHSSDVHEIENYRNLLRDQFLVKPVLPNFSYLQLPNGIDDVSRGLTIHLWPGGSQAKAKEWPLSKWNEFLKSLPLKKDKKITLNLSGGPGDFEKNQNFINQIPEETKLKIQIKNRAGISLQESLELFARSVAVVTVDTGVAHLAAATGVRTIVLYGPTSPKRWGALGTNCKWIVSNHPNSGKISLGFENICGSEVMDAISVNMLIGELENVFSS